MFSIVAGPERLQADTISHLFQLIAQLTFKDQMAIVGIALAAMALIALLIRASSS
ncbi:MAG: hypothetical protein M1383_02760 [Patescibacteria group bacterium]|nr:hypothetical protein [Patescibacteria group bacterium]